MMCSAKKTPTMAQITEATNPYPLASVEAKPPHLTAPVAG
jgi:hypothetical protein